MKSAAPPRLAETLLAGCITDARLSDAVLGDMAEDWQIRALQQGPTRAGVWYWKQSLRSAPCLLAHWWRRASPGEVAWKGTPALAVFGLVGFACITTHYFQIALADFMIGLLGASSDGGDPLLKDWDAIALLAVAESTRLGLVGGCGFALFLRNAPMTSIAMLATLWFPGSVIMPLILPPQWPIWAFLAFPLLMFSVSLVGGLVGTTLRFYCREGGRYFSVG